MSAFTPDSSFPCASGNESGIIPCLGFGTATLRGDGAVAKIQAAIDEGYRMLDTALLYGNQQEVGEAVKNSGIPREEFWITSKVSFFPPADNQIWMYNANNLVGEELASIDLSLELLDMTYVDLCLIHNPWSVYCMCYSIIISIYIYCGHNPSSFLRNILCCTCNLSTSAAEYSLATLPHFFELFNVCGYDSAIKPDKLPDGTGMRDFIIENKRKEIEVVDKKAAYESRKNSWLQMESALALGKCKRIGVSNYTADLLLELKEYANVMPAVNEIEFHPRFASPELVALCRDLNVVLIGYGTGHYIAIEQAIKDKSSRNAMQILNSIVERVAKEGKKKSPLQVVLRWMLQLGVVSIPRSGSAEHMKQNRDIFDFELSVAEMKLMDDLNEDYPYYWDPVPTNMTLVRR